MVLWRWLVVADRNLLAVWWVVFVYSSNFYLGLVAAVGAAVVVAGAVADGSGVIVPAGARHNVRNGGAAPLKLYTLYGPPEHKDQVVQSTKAEADARHHDEEWDGGTTE